jgi:hypothetical protein
MPASMNPSIRKERATLASEVVWNADAANQIVIYPESAFNSRRKLALAYKRIPVGGGIELLRALKTGKLLILRNCKRETEHPIRDSLFRHHLGKENSAFSVRPHRISSIEICRTNPKDSARASDREAM